MPLQSDSVSLQAQQEALFGRLQGIWDFASSANRNKLNMFEAKLQRLPSIENALEKLQLEIIEFNSKTADPKSHVKLNHDAFDDLFDVIRSKYLEIKEQASESTTGDASALQGPTAQCLKPLEVPNFDGSIDTWSNFITIYRSVVHENSSIPVTLKYLYLRSYLSGEALSLISDLALEPSLYEQAYKKLLDRYDSPRRITNFYLNKILQYKPTGSLSRFINVHFNAINTLKSAPHVEDLSDFLLFSLCYRNLEYKFQTEFDSRVGNTIPTCVQLFDFLTVQSKSAELHEDVQPPKPVKVNTQFHSRYNVNKSLFSKGEVEIPQVKGSNDNVCPYCKEGHTIYACTTFKNLNVPDKYSAVKKMLRCFKCLGNHTKGCKSSGRCRTCSSRYHHSFLHDAAPKQPLQSDSATLLSSDNQEVISACNFSNTSKGNYTVLLGTIQGKIQDINGDLQPVRCILDSGSQINAITSACVQRLGHKYVRHKWRVSGLADTSVTSKGIINCLLISNISNQQLNIPASVFPKITGNIPACSLPIHVYERFKDLPLADPNFHVTAPVDILLGADVCCQVLFSDNGNNISGNPLAISTMFGYVLLGNVPYSPGSSHPTSLCIASESLENEVKNFWQLEEVSRPVLFNDEDEYCETHFVKHHSRDESGRYIVALPFKSISSALGHNREIAYKSYLNLEKRLARSFDDNEVYNNFLKEYEFLGHMSVTQNSSDYVLPHHAVHKSTSSTTKLRVVFNGSAIDSTGRSLNQRLCAGPKLQSGLPQIIFSFRAHKIAVCADIRMMYRQIIIRPQDRSFQHIFWRPFADSDVLEYELNTLTYGLTLSSFIAQRVLRQLVSDEGRPYPLASQALLNHTYMDDVLSGANSTAAAHQLQTELVKLLSLGQFQLRKWSSNDRSLLEEFESTELENSLTFSDEITGIKILGLVWNPDFDNFTYYVLPFEEDISKRCVLSYMARIFDPLGWLAPVVFLIKYYLQQLWVQGIGWDDKPPPDWCLKWEQLCSSLPELSQLKIPRCLFLPSGEYSLLGFCDASEKGYAACVYLHATTQKITNCNLLQAKSKIAPLKFLSIPRMELLGAVLLARLVHSIISNKFPYSLKDIRLFTDSQVVLAWLKTPSYLLKTFVANRVEVILENSNLHQWHHISGKENPADIASRGLTAPEIIGLDFWWHGPSNSSDLFSIPLDTNFPLAVEDIPEMKLPPNVFVTASYEEAAQFLDKYSSLTSLQRIVAYVNRFAYNCRNPNKKLSGPLSSDELHRSLDTGIRLTQRQFYTEEMNRLKSNKNCSKPLQRLSPFIDSLGLVRVGGRLRHSRLSYDNKHPVLLPKQATLSRLLCDYYHHLSMHSGAFTTQSLIQRKYWIIGIRSLVRQRIHNCVRCLRFRANSAQPLMADQPSFRVQLSRAFTHFEMDFAGRLCWHLGRVQKLIFGTDGIARVASVKTSSGCFTRPVNKLIVLPVSN